ncbi:hypothetical protein ACKVEX_04585 [Rhodocyclaceae bacterium SMB388]
MDRKRVLILGAAGRDFHDFNVLYRHDPAHEVVGFTAAQIPNIDERRYPATLAGPYCPEGIPIFPEHALADLIDILAVQLCVFAYSDVLVINKLDSAPPERVRMLLDNIHQANPAAVIVRAESRVSLGDAGLVAGRRVLVIEDGPTLTHGEMASGAGLVAALAAGAAEIVDPRPFAVGSIATTLSKWPHIGRVLPAIGYGAEQRHDLEDTIAACDCDSVVIGTPIDLARVIRIDKPSTRVRYELAEIGRPDLGDVLDRFIDRHAIEPGRA